MLYSTRQVEVGLEVVSYHGPGPDLLPVEHAVQRVRVHNVDGDDRQVAQLGNAGSQSGQLKLALQSYHGGTSLLLENRSF